MIENITGAIGGLDKQAQINAQKKLDSLTKPLGSLGRLEDIARQICGIRQKTVSSLGKKVIVVMAADHGVVAEGVSAYPQEVTPQMVYNFLNGGAGINVLSAHVGAEVKVVDMGIAQDMRGVEGLIDMKISKGTKNMAEGKAMTTAQAKGSVEKGIELALVLAEQGYTILGTGDMGIGNTTASSAITSVICGAQASDVTGYGTGIDEESHRKKIETVIKSIKKNRPDPSDGIDVLSKVGGFEIGGIAGLILGCAFKRIPVVIDGFISGAGALIAATICPRCKDFMIASHCSVEKGHKVILDWLGLKAMFDFDMRLGEGTGAALGIGIAEASIKILNEMATFSEAGVSEKDG